MTAFVPSTTPTTTVDPGIELPLGGSAFFLILSGGFLVVCGILCILTTVIQERLELTRRAERLHLLTPDQLKIVGEFKYPAGTDHTMHECSICISAFTKGDACRTLPHPCDHTFHKACIDKWFEKSSVCPLCNRNFYEQFQEQAVLSQQHLSLGAAHSENRRESRSLFFPSVIEGEGGVGEDGAARQPLNVADSV